MAWTRAWSWRDVAAKSAATKAWKPSKAAEKRYAAQLRSVAGEVAALVGKDQDPDRIQQKLKRYSESLDSWAEQAAANMVRAARRRNEQTWREAAERWGIDLKGLLGVDIEEAVRARVAENVLLIKSLPLQTAERVGELARQAALNGTRAETLAKEIARQGDVTMSRARTIALTEVSKAGTALTRARAQGAGSDGYIWRTARDGSVRPSHAAMEGKFVRWDQPVTLDGMTGHAGEFPNCHCYPEPVVPDSAGNQVASQLPTAAQEAESGSHKLRSQWERTNFNPVIPHPEYAPLHNVERAVFVPDKLTRYSLDPNHPKGKHKARTWKAALGFDQQDAAEVERLIMEQLPHAEASRDGHDEHGERFVVISPITGRNGRSVDVRSVWIYKRDNLRGTVSTQPRLVTVYPEKATS